MNNADEHVLRISKEAKRAILRELRLLGVTREQLFSDIEGVARGILDEFFY